MYRRRGTNLDDSENIGLEHFCDRVAGIRVAAEYQCNTRGVRRNSSRDPTLIAKSPAMPNPILGWNFG